MAERRMFAKTIIDSDAFHAYHIVGSHLYNFVYHLHGEAVGYKLANFIYVIQRFLVWIVNWSLNVLAP